MTEAINLKALYSDLHATEAHRRYEAAILLGTPSISGLTPQPDMVERLVPLLDDGHDHVRYYAAVSLGNLGFPAAIGPLERRLSKEQEVTGSTIDVVAGIEQALEKLRE